MEQRLTDAELKRALKGGVFTQRFVPGEDSDMHAQVPDDRFTWRCIDNVELRDSGGLAALFELDEAGREEARGYLERRERNSEQEDGPSLDSVEEQFDEFLEKAEELPEAKWALTRRVQSGWNVKISAAGVQQSFNEPGSSVAEFVSLFLQHGPQAVQGAKASLRVARRFAKQAAKSEGWDRETQEQKLAEAFREELDLIRSRES